MRMTSGGAARAILNGALALAVVLGLVFAVWGWLRDLPYRGGPDYSAMPPSQAFESILGYPPPPGVTNLRVAGHAFLGSKYRAWMSFDVTDAALRSLLKDDTYDDAYTGTEAKNMLQKEFRPSGHRDIEHMQHVKWSEVSKIEKPEVYLFGQILDGSFVWAGWMIVDRKRHRAYVKLNGD
jgi:hypothetical protein